MFFPGCWCCGGAQYYLRRVQLSGASSSIVAEFASVPQTGGKASRLWFRGGKLFVAVYKPAGQGHSLYRYDAGITTQELAYAFTQDTGVYDDVRVDVSPDGAYVGCVYSLAEFPPGYKVRCDIRDASTGALVRSTVVTTDSSPVVNAWGLELLSSSANYCTSNNFFTSTLRYENSSGTTVWFQNISYPPGRIAKDSNNNIWRQNGTSWIIYNSSNTFLGQIIAKGGVWAEYDSSGGQWIGKANGSGGVYHADSSFSVPLTGGAGYSDADTTIIQYGVDPTTNNMIALCNVSGVIKLRCYNTSHALVWETTGPLWGTPAPTSFCVDSTGAYAYIGGFVSTG